MLNADTEAPTSWAWQRRPARPGPFRLAAAATLLALLSATGDLIASQLVCGMARFTGAVDPVTTLASGTDDGPFWEAVPRDVLLIPLEYTTLHPASPLPDEVLTSLLIEVRDAEGNLVDGAISSAQRMANNLTYVVAWEPRSELAVGARYQASVRPGDLEDPTECGVEYQEFYFAFTTSTEGRNDWVQSAALALRDAQLSRSSSSDSCCAADPEDCPSNEPCYQCWDIVETPEVYAEWSGPGLAYLNLELSSQTDNLLIERSGPRLGATVAGAETRLQSGVLTAYGDYCLTGTVSTDALDPRSIDLCASASEETIARSDVEIECRTRVPISTCINPPGHTGLTNLSYLFVRWGATEAEALANLQAERYHPTEGCVARNSTSGGDPMAPLDTSSDVDAGSRGAPTDSAAPAAPVPAASEGSNLAPDPPASPSPAGSSCAMTQRHALSKRAWLALAFAGFVGLKRRDRTTFAA